MKTKIIYSMLLIIAMALPSHGQENKLPAKGEIDISIPHGASALSVMKMSAYLIKEKLGNPTEEVTIAEAADFKPKWSEKDHGFVGDLSFKEITPSSLGTERIKVVFTGSWGKDPITEPFYSSTVKFDKVKDGQIDLGKVNIRFKKP